MSSSDDLSDIENNKNNNNGEGREVEVDPILEMIKKPPPYKNILEEFDVSNAYLIEIDGETLKKKDFDRYKRFVNFAYECRRKCNVKHFFCHPGDDEDVDDGIVSYEGEDLEDDEESCRQANDAISIYNALTKDGKLTLEKLLKVNFCTWYGFVFFMTFTARNEHTGEVGIYQAAITTMCGKIQLLGLFRDWSNDKVLAALSVTGAEEDFAVERLRYKNCLERAGVVVE